MAILAASMSAGALRLWLIGMLVVAAIVSVVANKASSPFLGWVSFAVFLCAVVLYVRWRRAALAERRARVFDREAKTDEDRTRADR
jgi:type II secretory pathway pseudopilin PulG